VFPQGLHPESFLLFGYRDFAHYTAHPRLPSQQYQQVKESALDRLYQCIYNVYGIGGSMVKKLVRHGNSLALVIDKPVLELLKINEDTPLEIETSDGKSLQIRPALQGKNIKASLEKVNKKFGSTLKNLSK
jgi:antitoxin component of MazEF toxin-antitoxin module